MEAIGLPRWLVVVLSEHLTLPHGIGLSNCFPEYFPETFRGPVMPVVPSGHTRSRIGPYRIEG